MKKAYVHVLRCNYLPLDVFVVGVYTSHKRAKLGWKHFCENGGWERSIGGRPIDPEACDYQKKLLDNGAGSDDAPPPRATPRRRRIKLIKEPTDP